MNMPAHQIAAFDAVPEAGDILPALSNTHADTVRRIQAVCTVIDMAKAIWTRRGPDHCETFEQLAMYGTRPHRNAIASDWYQAALDFLGAFVPGGRDGRVDAMTEAERRAAMTACREAAQRMEKRYRARILEIRQEGI